MTKFEHVRFNGLNFEPNKKLGYYLVDGDIYYNKYQALLEATKKKARVQWYFNEDVFIRYPWHVEPEQSLEELYRKRAQDLRDQYDYIRLECSGGSDSVTVAYSFLLNGIHLDEIIFRYPKKSDKDYVGNAWDLRSQNMLSEWQFATKPLLDWIATNYPAVKITVYDFTEDLLSNNGKDQSWIFSTRHYLQPSHVYKYSAVGSLEQKRLAEKNLRVCVLWGVDKPRVCVKDKKWFFRFNDGQASHSDQTVGEYTNVTNEFFYWSPDACDLLAKQAHTIKRWFEQPEHASMQHVMHWPNHNFTNRTVYEQVVKSLIYKNYDCETFQTAKPTNNIWNEMDNWIHHKFNQTDSYKIWQAGIDFLVDNLDPAFVRYLDGRPTNIIMYETPLYSFADSNIPELHLPFTPGKDVRQHKIPLDRQHLHVINGRLVIY